MRYHSGMAQLLVRNLTDEAVTALKALAEKNGRSVEAEHRELIEGLAKPSFETWLEDMDRLREATRGRGGEPGWKLIRQDRDSR